MFFNTLFSVALAGPEGAQVVNGQVSFQQSGYNTTITASDKAIINYSSFDIARPEVIQFIQPNSSASVLNRIHSANPTNINGTLLANGRVFFVNPAGVYIGAGARVNVNQLVASGLNITNSDFINGRFNFEGGNGSVINGGDITAEKVFLIGKEVVNSGSIHCPAGYVVMAAGDRVFLSEPGSDVMVEIDPQTSSDPATLADSGPGVLSQDEVDAAGGRIVLAAGDIHTQAISNVGSLAASIEIGGDGQISNTGTIEARSDTTTGGTIIAEAAEVTNSGTVDATGSEGGEVTMRATGRLGQFGTIHADGTTGNGGNVELRADDVVALSSDSLTTANAGTIGDGGEVTVYSPDTALFHKGATIEAKGGSESGDGGFVEVSGKEHVEVFGLSDVSANNGDGGTFFIDPHNVTIQDGTGTLDSGGNPFSAGSDGDTVSDDAIEGVINTGGAAVVQTSDGGLGEGDIIQDADATIDFTGAGGDASLTLNAADDVELNGGIDVTGATAALTVAINANGAYGTASGEGDVDINAAIATNGGSFTSSGVDFDNTGGEITTGGGNVNLDGHTGAINIGANIVADTGDISAISGRSVLVRAQASGITAGNVDIDTTGTFACEPGSRITAGGDGTDLNVNAEDIILNAYGVGNETLTNTGTGTITLTASGDTFLADHSINVDEGTLNINSTNIRTSPLVEPMMSLSQKVENNSNIMAAEGTGSEIKANGVVSLTAGAIGDGEDYLELDGAAALEITATGAGGIWIRENASTIKSTAITVDEPKNGGIDIDYAEIDDNDDEIKIWFEGGHVIGNVDLDNDSDSSFSYTAESGDIILGAEGLPINMGDNGDVTLSTSGDIVIPLDFPDLWEKEPVIITAGGSVSLTADGIYSYTYNGSSSTVPLGIQGATVLTLTDNGPGPMWLKEFDGSTIGSTSITVGDIGYGTIDIAYNDERSWVDIDNDHFVNSVVLPFSFSYTATKGDISIGSIEMFSEFPGEVDIIAGGAIRDAVDDAFEPGLDVVCATINLTAVEGGIGTPVSFMDDDVFFVEDRILEVTTSRELYADTTADGGDILISSLGDLPVGLVDAGIGNVTLYSTGAIRDVVDDSGDAAADVVGAAINLIADAGGIGTPVPIADNGVAFENRVLEVTAGAELNADTTADGADILISSIGDLPVGLVDAGVGDVTLHSTGAIRDAIDDSGELNVDVTGTTINLIADGGEIGTSVGNAPPEDRVLEVTASTAVNAEAMAEAQAEPAVIVLRSLGDLPVGLVDAGAGDVTLYSTDAITEAIDDPEAIDIRAGSIWLYATTGISGNLAIETSAARIVTRTGRGDIDIDNDTTSDCTFWPGAIEGPGNIRFSQTGGGSLLAYYMATNNGSIHIDLDNGDLTASEITVGGGGAGDNLELITTNTGDVLVDSIAVADNAISINSAGAILDSDGVTNSYVELAAGTLHLSAGANIGTLENPIKTDATTIEARTTEPAGAMSHIAMSNVNAADTFLTASTVGEVSSVIFNQTGGGQLTLTDVSTADGDIRINADSGSIVAKNASARGNYDVSLTTTTSGDVIVDSVIALDNTVKIDSAGAIRGAIDDTGEPDVDVVGAMINLTAQTGGIGTEALVVAEDGFIAENRVLEITAGKELNADTTADGGHILISSPGDLPVGLLNAGAGDVTLNSTGSIRDAINDSGKPELDVAGAKINLTARAGGIGTEAMEIAENGFFTENRVLEITASTELNADTTADNGHILISSIGDLMVGFVDVETGDVTLNATGAIKDAVDDSLKPGLDVVGATINLTAVEGGIGTSVSFMDDDVVLVEDRVLEVTAGKELNADTTADGGHILVSSPGDLAVGLVNAGAGDVTLNSAGAIRGAIDDTGEPDVDVVGAMINLTARAGGIGTAGSALEDGVLAENGVLEVTASRELNADTAADGGHILISSPGDLPVGLVTAARGDVTLNSTGAIRDAVDDSPKPGLDVVGATINLTAGEEGIGTSVSFTDDDVFFVENRVLEVTAGRDLNADITADGGHILINSLGDLQVGLVNAGTGDVTLNATGATRDAINDSDKPELDVAGATIKLTAWEGGIGTEALVVTEDGFFAENRVLEITADTELNADATADGGHILISSPGDLPVGLVNAGTGNVILEATGAIREALDDPDATNIRAGSVQLSAATAITGNSPIETSARSITARTDEGDIDIDNDNTLPITVSLEVSTGTGNIKFRQTGGGALTAQEATTQDGTIHIEVDSAELTAGNITAGGQGNIIVRADGDVKVGNVTALDNQITINSAGAIKESVNDRDVDLTAASLALTAKDGIGIHRSGESLDIKIPVPIETDAASIVAQTEDNAKSSSHIFINVQNTENTLLEASTVGTGSCIAFRQADGGELNLKTLQTNDGSITVGADGDVKVGSITAFDNQITIDSAGAIDDAAVDVVTDFTAETLTLTAYDGIGATAEIETDVSSLSAHSIASNIMIVEKDTTSLDRIILIDVDTIDGRINITVEEAVGATGDTVLTAVDADGDDDEDEVVITAAAGDITIGEVSADNVSLEATQGSINDASDDTITDITGDLLMLTARDEIGGSPTAGTTTDTCGAIEVASTGLDVSVNTAGDIVLTESDGTELTDVDTAGGSIDIVSTTGDLTVGDIDATTTVSLEATTGSINDAADDTIVDITANVLTLTARDEIGGNPTPGKTTDTLGAIETTVASLDASSNTAGDIVITETDNVILQDIQTTNGNITLQATGGAITHLGKTITANGGSLTMTQRDSLDLKDFTFGNQSNTDITLQSNNGSITAVGTANGGKDDNAADQWQSIQATAENNIVLQGSDAVEDIKIGGPLFSNSGGVSIISDNGTVRTAGDTILDNVAITGSSDGTTGVPLPTGSGKAAIVIRSKGDLQLGPSAILTAKGNYGSYKTGVDDRPGVGFKSRGEGSGDPIDVAIYVGNSDLKDIRASLAGRKGGNVTVECPVSIDGRGGGTMVIDAENTVNDFGKKFTTSWKKSWERNNGTNRLEVVSRTTQTLDEAVKYGTLPHAKEVRQGKAPSWFKEETPTWFKGENPTWFEVETPTWFGGSKYVLRGKRVAEVLTNVESAPMDSDQDERRRRRERLEEEDHISAAPLDIRDRYDNRVRKIEQGMPLRNGYKIKTGEDIRSFIEFPDGTEIIVEPNTSVTIESGGIFVSSGKIWFWSMFTSPIGGFKIRTAHVTINLTGTEGGVEVSPDGEATSVWTLKDQVDIKDQVVREGEAALIWQDLIFAKNPLLAQESDDLQKRLNDGKGAHIQKAGWFPLSFIGALTPSPRFFWESIPQ